MPEILLKLEMYEGPLDLLLHLIKKNEVDINDIPVALITAQYLEYLEIMQSFNVELAGEFLLMAATLIDIKSRLLLPVLNEKATEEDPRLLIIKPLLEHAKVKSIAEVLNSRHILNRDVFLRAYSGEELASFLPGKTEETVEASFYDLLSAFKSLAIKEKALKALDFLVENKSISEKILEIRNTLIKNKTLNFETVLKRDKNKNESVLSFLAILELAKIGFLRIYQNLNESSEIVLYLIDPRAKISKLEELEY